MIGVVDVGNAQTVFGSPTPPPFAPLFAPVAPGTAMNATSDRTVVLVKLFQTMALCLQTTIAVIVQYNRKVQLNTITFAKVFGLKIMKKKFQYPD